jgi:hypothetical protein
MRSFPEGFYADLGLRLAALWEAYPNHLECVASTRLHPQFFEQPHGLDPDRLQAAEPRAIFFRW